MVVGDDQAVLRDEEAGTEGARFAGARRFLFLLLTALLEEVLETRHAAELFEELIHVAELTDVLSRNDVDRDNGRFDLFNQVCKAERCPGRCLDGNRLGPGFGSQQLWNGERGSHDRGTEGSRYERLGRNAKFIHQSLQRIENAAISGDETEHKHATGNVVIKRQLGDFRRM